ncbi:MAG: threonine/serine dehydratase [Burkholderiales bacterium]
MLDLARVKLAAERLRGVAHRTPVVTSHTLDDRIGAKVFLKNEGVQRAGAFKFRGAFNALSALPDDARRRGVVAWSSGNHAQAVALAARLFKVRAVIVMPTDAPITKLDGTRGYGADIVLYDRYKEDRVAIAMEICEREGLTPIPAYDDFEVMAGQGTAALELFADAPDLDVFLVPVGGGGLMAGCATVASAHRPSIKIFGVEPEAGDDTKRSFDTGERVTIPVPQTIADGLQVNAPGELTLAVNRKLVTDILTVSDASIVRAMRFLFERLKLVVEPSGAVPVAAMMDNPSRFAGKRVGAILSGGNVGVDRFVELIGKFPQD